MFFVEMCVFFFPHHKDVGLLNSLARSVRRHCWISSSGTPSGKCAIVVVVVVVVPLLRKLLGCDFAIFTFSGSRLSLHNDIIGPPQKSQNQSRFFPTT